jgi:hypothetical protein
MAQSETEVRGQPLDRLRMKSQRAEDKGKTIEVKAGKLIDQSLKLKG